MERLSVCGASTITHYPKDKEISTQVCLKGVERLVLESTETIPISKARVFTRSGPVSLRSPPSSLSSVPT